MNTDNIREAFDRVHSYCLEKYGVNNMMTKDVALLEAAHADSEKRIAELEADVKHWKNNHAHEVERARLIKNRPDVPLDRAKAYDRCALDKVEALQADNKRLLRAVQVMVDDGWLYHGDEGMSEAQAEVYETWKALSPTESLEDK